MGDARHESLQQLVESNARLWAGEAEVVRTYWRAAVRTRETDLLWLARQCYKEFWGGFVGRLERVALAHAVEGDGIRDLAKEMYEEISHYRAFADAYDALRPDAGAAMDPYGLERDGDWTENAELTQIRSAHRRQHGRLGELAHTLTEGGAGALYSEGKKLKGCGGSDEIIAIACAKVYDDELEHMSKAIASIGESGFLDSQWLVLTELTVEQMRYRIHMRNAQFSFPLSQQRIEEIFAGGIEPRSFQIPRFPKFQD